MSLLSSSLLIHSGLLLPLLDFSLEGIHWLSGWRKWCLSINHVSWVLLPSRVLAHGISPSRCLNRKKIDLCHSASFLSGIPWTYSSHSWTTWTERCCEKKYQKPHWNLEELHPPVTIQHLNLLEDWKYVTMLDNFSTTPSWHCAGRRILQYFSQGTFDI